MITSLLIANRAEIARRILRTCREMGIRGVVIYSDADADTPAVREADLALRVGAAPAAESYLNAETILALALGNGCEAIHPGYGFLSESAAFSAACAGRGVIFVGAPPEAIRAMGDKAEAKRRAVEAGVPVLPGFDGENASPAALKREAARIGFPLLVKAVGGGGGRGIRIVRDAAELEEALASARREAEAAFGDGRVMLERFLDAPRHVEFQIMADRQGTVLHLFERECSVQRRHQKIIEEAPSPALTPALREAMGAAAAQAARAVGYVGAGTVEFLLDGEGRYYFLEMNTRLQVEHPVTELTLGLDLVRMQIEIAEGRPLALAQGELTPRGHAIECRLNAEDPAREFLPATGRLGRFDFPSGPGLRVDAGFEAGSEITPHYDSLLAKLICWGPTREETLRKARRMLAGSFVSGLPTNLSFLQWVLERPAFAEGRYTTRLLEEGAADWRSAQDEPGPGEWLLAAAAVDARLVRMERLAWWRAQGGANGAAHLDAPHAAESPWERAIGWRASSHTIGLLRRVYHCGARRYDVSIVETPDTADAAGAVPWLSVTIDGIARPVRLLDDGNGQGRLDLGTVRLPLRWDARGAERWLALRGQHRRLIAEDPAASALKSVGAAAGGLRAPLPGKVIRIVAAAGQTVAAGELLMIVEAMKVEHRIHAPVAGKVEALHFAEGDRCDRDDLLLDFTADEVG